MAKRIALIIHNHSYRDPKLGRLAPPAADIATLAALLADPAGGNFSSVESLTNPPLAELRRQVADLFHRKQRYDELLLYFVGHGLVDEGGQLYLAAVDTRLDTLAETALPAAYLTECMDRSFSRRQLLLLDCTYHSLAAPNHTIQPGAAFKGKGVGRVVLTSTDTIQPTLTGDEPDDEGQAAGFTCHLIEALQTGDADSDKDGQIELKELHQYLQRQARPTFNGFQPCLRLYGDHDRFIIARNPQLFVSVQPIKWDLISGAILAPTTIIVIGGWADLRASVGLAGLFLLMYAFLYLAPD